jgi:DNA-binding MarR family transcriptional regulator
MDAVIDGWRRELPELDRPEFDLVKRAARLGQLLEEALGECLAPWNLVKADYNVLSVLRTAGAQYELRPTDLRNRLLLTSGGVSNIVNRLERLNLVQRIPDPADRRSAWVRLTAEGAEVAEEIMQAWAAVQQRMFTALSPELARQGSDTLRAVLLALGDREPEAPASRPAGLVPPGTAGNIRMTSSPAGFATVGMWKTRCRT